MAGPWEKYGNKAPAEGPWSRYQTPEAPERGFLRRVDDVVRGVADTASFGFADEISAGMNAATGSGDYAGNVAQERARDSEGGWERVGGQVAGALLNPAAAARTVGRAALQGAGWGGLYGFGSGEGSITERLPSVAAGAFAGGAAGAAVRRVANSLGTKAATKSIPSNDDLQRAATAAYNKAEAAGVVLKPQGLRELARTIVDDAAEFGFDPALQPGVAAALRRFQQLGEGNVTLKGLDIVRRVTANAAKVRENPSQQALASKIIDRIDDFVDTLSADAVLTGNVKHGAAALKEARNLWGQLRKSQMVDTAALKAERRSASTGSGGNADNAMRQNVRSLLDNPKTSRGMTPAERNAAERVVRGTRGQNGLRLAGKLAPTGVVSGGIGTSMGAALGSLVGGPAGAAVGSFALPAAGQAAKMAADRMTMKNVERLSQIIRSGGRTGSDLAALARGGKLENDQIARIEAFAKRIGISVPEIAAMVADRATNY